MTKMISLQYLLTNRSKKPYPRLQVYSDLREVTQANYR